MSGLLGPRPALDRDQVLDQIGRRHLHLSLGNGTDVAQQEFEPRGVIVRSRDVGRLCRLVRPLRPLAFGFFGNRQ